MCSCCSGRGGAGHDRRGESSRQESQAFPSNNSNPFQSDPIRFHPSKSVACCMAFPLFLHLPFRHWKKNVSIGFSEKGGPVERLHCKRPIPICRLFFKIDLLTYIAALCLTDFIDWRYIHSLVGIFDPACELLPPWKKELYLCTFAPLSSLWPPPPLPKLNVLFIQTVSDWGWGVNCAV